MIAMALSYGPKLLIANQPTTALDVSIQAQIITLLQDPRASRHLSGLVMSRKLSLVRARGDREAVMCVGQMIELFVNRALYGTPPSPVHQSRDDSEASGGSQGTRLRGLSFAVTCRVR